MSRARFAVSFEIVTQESAENGEAHSSGFEWPPGTATLRDAVDTVRQTRTNRCDGIESVECDSWPVTRVRWITVNNGMEFETGARESRSLHIPESVSASSSRRIARLVGARV